jgi:hypothetical protein
MDCIMFLFAIVIYSFAGIGMAHTWRQYKAKQQMMRMQQPPMNGAAGAQPMGTAGMPQ